MDILPMKRFVTLLLLLSGFIGASFAQTTFEISSNSVWTITPGEVEDMEGHITIHNPTNAVQTIKWERTVINITPGCLSQICDLNLCYIPSVSTKTFDIVADGTGNIIMHFLNPDLIANATALVNLKLSNLNNPADSVVVAYLFTPETSATKDRLPAASVKLFPNPTTDYFLLENADAVQRIRLFSLNSREVARYAATPAQSYSLAGLPTGSYVLALEDKNGQVFQAISLLKK